MRKLIVILVSIGLLLIENTILPTYSIFRGFPSLVFVFAMAYSVINGRKEAIFIGVVSGFLQDIFFVTGFGVNLLLNLLLCYLAAMVGESIFKENRLIPVLASFVISILKIVGVLVLLRLFNMSIDLERAFVSALLNGIVMIFMYKIVLTTSEKYISRDTWRFR